MRQEQRFTSNAAQSKRFHQRTKEVNNLSKHNTSEEARHEIATPEAIELVEYLFNQPLYTLPKWVRNDVGNILESLCRPNGNFNEPSVNSMICVYIDRELPQKQEKRK